MNNNDFQKQTTENIKQISVNDILKAKEVYFYNNSTIYIRLDDDEVYGFTCGTQEWYHKRNFEDYFDSPLVLACFADITREEAARLYETWQR